MSEQTEDLINEPIKIFDRTYHIKCKLEEVEALHMTADFLDEEMRKISRMNHIKSTDQVAVLTSLNLAHELLNLKETSTQPSSSFMNTLRKRLIDLQKRINETLETREEVAL